MSGHDPQKVGEWLAKQRAFESVPLSEICDRIPWNRIPPVPSETQGSLTAKVYHDELVGRAEAGDRYAESMLAHLTDGVPLSDDPSGG